MVVIIIIVIIALELVQFTVVIKSYFWETDRVYPNEVILQSQEKSVIKAVELVLKGLEGTQKGL